MTMACPTTHAAGSGHTRCLPSAVPPENRSIHRRGGDPGAHCIDAQPRARMVERGRPGETAHAMSPASPVPPGAPQGGTQGRRTTAELSEDRARVRMGKLFEMRENIERGVRRKRLDPVEIRARISMQAGFLLALITADTPDDPVRITKLAKAARDILGLIL